MAINVNQPDFRGLSSIRAGGGNIPVPGELGLRALALSLQEREALRRQALQEAKMRQADEMALRQQGIQRQKLAQQAQQNKQMMDYRNKALQAEQQYKQQQLQQRGYGQQLDKRGQDLRYGLGMAQLGAEQRQNKQQLMLDQMKLGMEQLADKKESELNKLGSFATSAKLALEQTTDPTEANILRNQIVDQAADMGIFPQEQADAFKKMPLSAFKRATDFYALQTGKASQLKAMRKQEGPGAAFTYTDSQGNTFEFNPLTSSNQTGVQKEVMYAQDNLRELNSIVNSVNDDMFGPSATKYSVTGLREWASGVPGLSGVAPSEEELESKELYNNLNARLQMLSMQTIKQLSGVQYSDKQLAFMKEILPEVGPTANRSTFDGKVANLTRFYKSIEDAKKKVLQRGIKFSSDPESKYAQELKEELKRQAIGDSENKPDPLGIR